MPSKKKGVAKRNTLTPEQEAKYENELAAVLDQATDPFQTLANVIKRSGMKETLARKLVKGARVKHNAVVRELRDIKSGEIARLLENTALAILESIDDADLATASLRDKALAAGIMIEKRQLLRGEPTEIVSVEEHKELDEVIPVIVAEAKRRGMIINAVPGAGYTVDEEPEVAVSTKVRTEYAPQHRADPGVFHKPEQMRRNLEYFDD